MANQPKKRKTADDNRWPDEETAEGTTETGLKFLDSLRQSKDKTGRLVADQFLQLPSPTDTAYYRKTPLPLSFKEIQGKLDRHDYPDMTALESDLKRMVQNAKEYHATGSKHFEDAERIRKAISNFMPKHNPAYRDEDYRAVATPNPVESEDHSAEDAKNADPKPRLSKAPLTVKLRVNDPPTRRNSMPKREKKAVSGGEADDGNMQEIQLEVVDEMISLRDPDDEETEITNEFFEKPPKKSYPDYYQQIRHPTALKDIRKAVVAGKFLDWRSFNTEVEFLWRNAMTYNEDDSFIYENAIKLRDWFIERMSSVEGARDVLPPKKLILLPPKQESDATVDTPTTGPRIKFTNKRKSESGGSLGITVDEEARRRQHAHVQAASQPVMTPSPVSQPSPVKMTPFDPTASLPPQPNSSRPTTAASQSDTAMSDAPVIASNQNSNYLTNDSSQGPAAPHQPPRPAPPVQNDTVFETIFRAPGKHLHDSLWVGLTVHTREEQNLENPYVRCFTPSERFTQQREVVHVLERQAKLRFVTAVRRFVLQREHFRVVLNLNGVEIPPHTDWGDGTYQWFVECPIGVQHVELDVMCHLNKKGEPAPVWPAERFEFEAMRIDFDVRPDWQNLR